MGIGWRWLILCHWLIYTLFIFLFHDFYMIFYPIKSSNIKFNFHYFLLYYLRISFILLVVIEWLVFFTVSASFFICLVHLAISSQCFYTIIRWAFAIFFTVFHGFIYRKEKNQLLVENYFAHSQSAIHFSLLKTLVFFYYFSLFPFWEMEVLNLDLDSGI